MAEKYDIQDRLTILINSCDTYEDLWIPCFTLLKKYWPAPDVRIVLNTETKCFQMDGLRIDCVNTPVSRSYAERMRNALAHIHTEYVLLMLDDFFLRKPVDLRVILRILSWMDGDEKIVCFNSDSLKLYAQIDEKTYPGYQQIPPGNEYALNMQAAIWRTASLKKYWKPDVSPWEWEEFSSALTGVYTEDKFYCRKNTEPPFMDYGHYRSGDLWAVVAGKWILEDVCPLFQKEDIDMDFSQRGEYSPESTGGRFSENKTRKEKFRFVIRCLGPSFLIPYVLFCLDCKQKLFRGKEINDDFFSHLRQRGYKVADQWISEKTAKRKGQ